MEILPASSIADAGVDFSNCEFVDSLQIGSMEALPNHTYSWNPSDDLSDPNVAQPYVSLNASNGQSISRTYTLTVISPESCVATSSVTISANARPSVSVQSSAELIVQGAPVVFSAAGAGATGTYEWTYTDSLNTTPQSFPNNTGESITVRPMYNSTYYVEGTTEFGCKNRDSIYVEVVVEPTVVLPSAFSPNGDGVNDEFKIITNEAIDLLVFQVYNRWGQLIFDAKGDINAGWDGTFNGSQQNVGVYVYFMEYQFTGTEEVKSIFNNVTLVR